MKIYTASKVIHADKWRALRASGVEVSSTWIDEAGPGESGDYEELASRCIDEVSDSNALLLYCEPGEVLKGALIEVGVAFAYNIRIFCVGECSSLSPVFRKHGLWYDCPDIKSALERAYYLCGYGTPPQI